MKLKPLIGIVLAIAMVAGLWLWRSRPEPPAKPLANPVSSKPVALNTSTPFSNSPVKMIAVASRVTSASSAAILHRTLWSAVQVIVDNRAGYETRLNAVHSLLASRLTDNDWTVLQQFLLTPDGLDRTQRGQVIKNELLDALCAMSPPPAGLGDVLAKMYQNQGQDEVVRDYAVQHLGAYYEQMTGQTNNAKALQSALNALWSATGETSDSIGGTALLALQRLSQEYTGIDRDKLAGEALQLANDGSAGELTHITAYQLCAQLGTADALPVVLQGAQNGETISVKLSAIGALGLLGGPEQIPFLNSVLAGTEDRLKLAAQHALDQINARQRQATGQK